MGLRASHGVPYEKGMRVDWKWGLSEVQFRSPCFGASREGWVIRLISDLGLSWGR